MPNITDISLDINGSVVLLILLFIAGLASVYFIYRSTVPPLRMWRRVLLAVVRIGALVSITGMLFTPVLNVSIEQSVTPLLSILVDNSASMNFTDRNGTDEPPVTRKKITTDLLQSSFFNDISRDFELRYYKFDNTVSEFFPGDRDSLRFDGEGTNISSALQHVFDESRDDPLRGVLLLSDGISNLGSDPVNSVSRAGVPVYSIGIGEALVQNDILISNLQVNEIAYTGENIPITVSIQGSGFGGKTATVTLTSDGNLLESRVIQLPDNNRTRSTTLNFFPSEAKNQKLNIVVSSQENELTLENNRREFFIKVLESKINILIVAGRPNQDYAFLKRSLQSNANYSVTGIVQKPDGTFYTNSGNTIPNPREFQVFVLVDFWSSQQADNLANSIFNEITVNNKPVMYIRGKSLSPGIMQSWAEVVSIANFNNRGREEEVYIQLTRNALDHPVFRIDDDPVVNTAIWNKIPPVFTSSYVPVPANTSEIMGRLDMTRSTNTLFSNTTPLFFLNRTEERKSLFINAYNLWRWKLLAQRDTDIIDFYDIFMNNCIRWLINKEDSKIFHVAASKEFYQNGERVIINAQVYTENYDPVEDAEVQITIEKQDMTLNRILQSIGDGLYTTDIEILEPGEYSVSSTASKGERQIGLDNTGFIIGEFNIEMQKTVMDSVLLGMIAAASGGRYFSYKGITNIPALLDPSRAIEYRNLEFEIWNKSWFMIAIITLLCLEWFFRKRFGML
ncbi:FixH family protein [candidate division KSB1 bacterium]|nr:FixH family protein [candidate division KSB1 bacterium]